MMSEDYRDIRSAQQDAGAAHEAECDISIASQRASVWSHLRQFGYITEDQAEYKFGCKRLSARIGELREEHGHERIRTVIKYRRNRVTGRKCKYADRYEYVTDEDIAAPRLPL